MSTPDTLSPILGMLLMGDGQHNSDWGAKTNANLLLIEAAFRSAAPIAEVKEFYGAALPSADYLWANGQAVKRTDYPGLFNVVGTTYGVGDNATTFNVPDRREVVAMGASTMGGTAARGLLATPRAVAAQFGEELHKLTTSEIPSHAHAVSDPGHSHGVNDSGHAHNIADPGHAHSYVHSNIGNAGGFNSGSGGNQGGYGDSTGGAGTGIGIYSALTGISIKSTGTGISINSTGGDGLHNNMQPTLVCNYIIRAK